LPIAHCPFGVRRSDNEKILEAFSIIISPSSAAGDAA
jgi:hypothetical protein